MRVVAYSIKSSEKAPLAIANHKKHEITLISNQLTTETVSFATGKEAVIVTSKDQVTAELINMLADVGVKYIATRSTSADHIDMLACGIRKIKIASVPILIIKQANSWDLDDVYAKQTILNLDNWQDNSCLGKSCICAGSCDNVREAVSVVPLTSPNEI